jgi:hypothetical protein
MIASPRPVIDAGYINAAVGQFEIDPTLLVQMAVHWFSK